MAYFLYFRKRPSVRVSCLRRTFINQPYYRMKRYLNLLFLAAAALCASCARDAVVSDVPPKGEDVGGYDNNVIVPGWVRIRLDDEAAPLRTGVFTRGEADSGNPLLDELAAGLGATEIREVFPTDPRFEERHRKYGLHLWFDIRLGDEVPVSRAEQEFAALPGVRHAQPIYRIVALDGADYPLPSEVSEPSSWEGSSREMPFNDPGLKMQWHYDNDGTMTNAEGETVAVEGADIGLFEAWEMYGAGDPSVIVAVMDTGVFSGHEDLQGNMWVNEAELNGTAGKDDDGNGYRDDIHGYDFYKKSPDVEPGEHGTHVAGTIAAVNDNGIGVSGVAGGTGNGDGVKLMTLQVMRDDAADDIPFNDVFPYAADNGAVIASCSWTISQTGMDQATKDGIDYFQANAGWDDTDGDGINDVQTGPMQGGLVIAGAGNSGTDKVFYPAKYKDVIGVGAIDGDMTVAWYSEYGEGIDVLAPGGNQEGSGEYNRPEIWGVYSTYPNGGYAYSAGTSMACPHVSGVAALILSKFKGQGFTAEELRNKVERSCRPLSEPMDPKYHGGIGNGLIDVTLALTEVPEEGPEKPQFEAIPAPASVRITGPVPVDGNGMPVVKYNFEYAEVVNGTAGEMTRTVLSNTYNAGEEFVYMFPGKSEAEYKFRMNAVDRYGNESEYIELQSETLEFENHAPTLLREFSDVEIRQAGEDYARLYTLVTYFEDEDAQYGDEMTFTVENSNDAVVRTELRNGRTLAVIPLTKGSCVVTVTATDTRGASTTAAINVTVLAGAGSAPTFKRQLGSLTLPAAGSFVRQYDLNDYVYDADMPDDELTFSAVSSDASVVTAAVTGTTLEVTGLKKGDATVQVTVTDRGGNSAENELFVSVAQEPGSQSGGATLRLYPNPATDYVNITLSGAGSGSADVVFYDSAARQVMKTTAELDASGTARIDGISGLTPGAYTVSVKQGGNTYKGTVLKR